MATIDSMLPTDTQQRQLLEHLRRAGDQPVALTELRGSGIDFPATVVSELELHGFAVERVYEQGRFVGVRLLQPESADGTAGRRTHGRLWPRRRAPAG